jgi:hypothetical protein
LQHGRQKSAEITDVRRRDAKSAQAPLATPGDEAKPAGADIGAEDDRARSASNR